VEQEEVPLAVLSADTSAAIDELHAAARAAREASRASSSERPYTAGWRDFSARPPSTNMLICIRATCDEPDVGTPCPHNG